MKYYSEHFVRKYIIRACITRVITSLDECDNTQLSARLIKLKESEIEKSVNKHGDNSIIWINYMNKYKKLVSNSIVFAIGSFGSKILNLVMVPLYTFVLTTIQYGTVDLLTTTISLLVPTLSLSIDEAVLRFVMLKDITEEKQRGVFTTAIVLNILSQLLFTLLVYPILRYFDVFGPLLNPFLALLLFSQIQTTLSQYTRGIGKVKAFALNGIIMTVVTTSMNVLLLVVYRFGLNGYIWSLIAANVISVIYLFIVADGWHAFSLKTINRKLVNKMIIYSVPLIPNMVIWWVISGSTRYFILAFLGASVNGLFAVANKIPSILSTFTTIFQQAWQLSAFEEFTSKKSKTFFSKVFEYYYQFLFIGCSAIYVLLKTVIPKVVGTSFVDSWMIMPILLLAVVYQSFSSFIGTNYTASMQTRGVFTSSIIGGIISVICNLTFIPLFGTIGTGIGTCVSFIITFVYRYWDTKKIFEFQLNFKPFLLNNFVIVIQGVLLYLVSSTMLLWISQIICFFLVVLLNRKMFLKLIGMASNHHKLS